MTRRKVFCITTLMMCCFLAGSFAEQSQGNRFVKKGTGAWVYGNNQRFVNEISAFNQMVKDPDKKIRYLFCYAGSVETEKLTGFDTSVGSFYKKRLPECEVYANIDGYPSINGISDKNLAELGKEIADKINADPNITGLHLDIEPYEPTQARLIEEYKKHSSKPVTISVDADSPMLDKLMPLADIVVLMNYDLGRDPVTYAKRSKDATLNLLDTAIKNHGNVMIGLPFIATHHEFQYRVKNTKLKETTQSGFTMADSLKGGLEGCREATKTMGNKNFVGVSIWAFLSEDDPVHNDTSLYYPASIGLAEWQLLLEK
jgi:hypothetical protein